MHLSVFLVIIACTQADLAISYFDDITAQSLIGSHFGIPFFNTSFDYVIAGGAHGGVNSCDEVGSECVCHCSRY